MISSLRPLFSRHREFMGHVATMVSGRSAAAAIGLLATPIVSRLFQPSDFGVAAAFLAIASIIADISSLRYEAAIVLPKQEKEALAIRSLAYSVLWVTSIFVFSAIAAVKASPIEFEAISILGDWVWLLPLAVLLTGAVSIQEGWLTRTRSFGTISSSLVLGTTTNSGIRIGTGIYFGSTAIGLIGADIIGTIVRFVQQRMAAGYVIPARAERAGLSELRRLARNYSDFPTLNAPAGFVTSLGGHLPVLLFGVMYSPVVAGLYAMAIRLSRRPTAILSSSMRKVFLQKAAAIKNRGKSLRKAFVLATGGLALMGLVPLLLISFYGQPIITWLLGERWTEAGRYLEIIAPWMFMIWVTSPANPIFVVLRRQSLWLTMTLVLTVTRLGVFGLAGVIEANVDWTLRAYVVATILSNCLTIAVALWIISRHDFEDRS